MWKRKRSEISQFAEEDSITNNEKQEEQLKNAKRSSQPTKPTKEAPHKDVQLNCSKTTALFPNADKGQRTTTEEEGEGSEGDERREESGEEGQ